MKFKKSKAIYLCALLMLAGTSLIDKINPRQEKIEVVITAADFPQVNSTEYASLSTNQNDNQNEKVNDSDLTDLD